MPPRRATRRAPAPPPQPDGAGDDDHLPDSVPPSPGATVVDDAEALPAPSAYVAPTPTRAARRGAPASVRAAPRQAPPPVEVVGGLAAEEPDGGVFRILISTDNHLVREEAREEKKRARAHCSAQWPMRPM